MSDNISIKLPAHIVTLHLPEMTTTAQVNFLVDEERITEDGETRITEDGETRILDGYDVTSYPEVVAVKLQDHVITVSVP